MPTVMTPVLTAADLRALAALFRNAHRDGRLPTRDFERTVVVLDAASHRITEQPGRAA